MNTVTRVVAPPIIWAELDERTAEALCALLGGIGALPPHLVELFRGLDAALPNREVAYGDLFTGTVRAKAEES